jgi:protein tyrosine phosphatase domain-containing protein 1
MLRSVVCFQSRWCSTYRTHVRICTLARQKYDLIAKFKAAGITAVINLTEPGEHPHCGDGLEATSGFPYLPETFMGAGILFSNFAWEDMTTPPLPLLADIVRVIAAQLRCGGKAAVHCHAGYGRTGLVIASTLVYTQNLSGEEAIAVVRR